MQQIGLELSLEIVHTVVHLWYNIRITKTRRPSKFAWYSSPGSALAPFSPAAPNYDEKHIQTQIDNDISQRLKHSYFVMHISQDKKPE